MSRERDLRELIGEDVPPAELDRLRRVHDLLVAAGPPPELSETLAEVPAPTAEQPFENVVPFMPRRRVGVAIVLAASLAAAAFFAGWAIANRDDGAFEATGKPILMTGTPLAANARASLRLAKTDGSGNTKLQMRVNGLPEVSGRTYYELYLTRKGDLAVTCGPFRVGEGTTTVVLSIPYSLKGGVYDGWVVTRERAGGPPHAAILMRTAKI